MPKEYKLIQTLADEKWDKFIDESPNGTIFSKSYYLKSSKAKYKLFYCYKKDELRASLVVIESEDGENLVLDDLVIYNGLLYNKPANKQNHSQQLSEQSKIQAYIAEALTNMYRNIELSLHPTIIDIRAFLWVNYGTDKTKYRENSRYTTYLNITDFNENKKLEDLSIYNRASTSRRQQIRYAIKKGYRTKISNDSELFIEFYKKMMDRQNLEVSKQKLKNMKNLIQHLISRNVAKLYLCFDEKDILGSMAFFAWDKKRAYYIFGANDPALRSGHSGTFVLWDAFYNLSNMGIDEIDLEGINSPHRGWFKLSFGGDLIPYYELSYKNQNKEDL